MPVSYAPRVETISSFDHHIEFVGVWKWYAMSMLIILDRKSVDTWV
jgi:hypothetical protein